MKNNNVTIPVSQIEKMVIESFKSEGYLIINKTLIKTMGLIKASILSNYIDKHQYFKKTNSNFDGWFFLRHKDQMEQLGLKEYSIQKAKHELIEEGIITTKKQGIPAKEWVQINFETLIRVTGLDPMNSGGQEVENSGGQDPEISGGHIRRTNIKENKENNTKESSSVKRRRRMDKITLKDFDSFWEIYPKKKQKGKAYTKWKAIVQNKSWQDERPSIQLIIKSVQDQIKTEQWQNSQYIPNPTTWLNQMRWKDDPKEMTGGFKDVPKPKQGIHRGLKLDWKIENM